MCLKPELGSKQTHYFNLGEVPELQLLSCIVISFCSKFIVRNCATGQKGEMEQTKQALLYCVAICEMPKYQCYLTYQVLVL